MTNLPYRPSGTPAYSYPGYPPQAGGQFPQYAPQTQQMQPPQVPSGSYISPQGTTVSQLPLEQSFIENILRLNLGKIGTFYMTYENNSEWNAKIFKGRIEAAGRDHIIISDPNTGMRYLLLMVNLDYVTFDEELKYSYPYSGQPLPPR
ncbi:spore coat protein GerQ [Paenibacillus rigui]|uniref:Spore coat protein GerQ n=1 Tax=Paenibacillus rigui TaxID=554312 RepID=A0A229UUR2_9BACL|nr:spore coat protein GerQ [Paenibacillus rigui]OXM87148.1 spore coat protein GerQ [Paenibacillus rigui]